MFEDCQDIRYRVVFENTTIVGLFRHGTDARLIEKHWGAAAKTQRWLDSEKRWID